MSVNVTLRAATIVVRFPVSTPGVGVPAGGAAGKVLAKVSADNYDTYWADAAAASISVTATAGENINAGRVVIVDGNEAFYYQPTNPAHAGRSIGITLNAATTGNAVAVQFAGAVTDAAYSSFSDAVLWAADNGQISTAIPSSGNVQKVGIGLGANTIMIDNSIQITQI